MQTLLKGGGSVFQGLLISFVSEELAGGLSSAAIRCTIISEDSANKCKIATQRVS